MTKIKSKRYARSLVLRIDRLEQRSLAAYAANSIGSVPDGRLKDMSCRVALLRMHRDGLIGLPPPRNTNGNGRIKVSFTEASGKAAPIVANIKSLTQLRLQPVLTADQSHLWNALIARYHYLGYTLLPGAQYRYLIKDSENLLGAIGFGAAAWKMAPRDQWIGWDHPTREKNLMYLANNNRFLILPWVHVKNLASKVLSLVTKRLPIDWRQRYGHDLFLTGNPRRKQTVPWNLLSCCQLEISRKDKRKRKT